MLNLVGTQTYCPCPLPEQGNFNMASSSPPHVRSPPPNIRNTRNSASVMQSLGTVTRSAKRSTIPKPPAPGERGWLDNMAARMENGKGLPTAASQEAEENARQEEQKKTTAAQPQFCTGCGHDEPPQEKRKRVMDVFDWLLCDHCHSWWHDVCGGSTAAEYEDEALDWLCPPCFCKEGGMPGLVHSTAPEDSSDEDRDHGAAPCGRKKKRTKQRRRRPVAADFFTLQSSPPASPPPTSTSAYEEVRTLPHPSSSNNTGSPPPTTSPPLTTPAPMPPLTVYTSSPVSTSSPISTSSPGVITPPPPALSPALSQDLHLVLSPTQSQQCSPPSLPPPPSMGPENINHPHDHHPAQQTRGRPLRVEQEHQPQPDHSYSQPPPPGPTVPTRLGSQTGTQSQLSQDTPIPALGELPSIEEIHVTQVPTFTWVPKAAR